MKGKLRGVPYDTDEEREQILSFLAAHDRVRVYDVLRKPRVRRRTYPNNAARQRAYRQRKKGAKALRIYKRRKPTQPIETA